MNRSYCWIPLLCLALLFSGCSSAPPQAPPGAPPALSAAPPAEAENLWRQAEREQKAGNIGGAIGLFERIVRDYPKSQLAAKALHRIGSIYLDQGQAERALQYLDYLVYSYPGYEGIGLAQFDRLRANWILGKKKQVMSEATPLWDTLAPYPDAQVKLSLFMADVYQRESEPDVAFDWLSVGFSSARSPDENRALAKATVDMLAPLDQSKLNKLYKKNPSEFMRVFLDYHLAQLETQKGQEDAGRQRMQALLKQNPAHPITLIAEAPVPTKAAQAAAAPLDPNRIGCLIPLNGPYAKYGQMVVRGLSLANKEWNERHPDSQVNIVIKDAPADADTAVNSFEQMVQKDGVLAVIGPLGAQASKAVAPVADKLGVPLFSLTQKEEDTTESPYVFHIFLDNHDLVQTLVRYCREKLGYTRFAALYPDDRYGQKISKVFAEVVQESGGNLLANVSYKEKTTDFKDPIQKLMTIAKKNTPPTGTDETPFEALFLPDQVQVVSMIAPQLPYYNVVGVTLLGSNLWSEGPIADAGGVYVENALFATPFSVESQSPRVRSFRERYEAAYNAAPTFLEAQAYDALMLLLQARFTSSFSSIDRASLIQNLLRIRKFEGVAGIYSFTPEGAVKRDYQILQISNGQLLQVAP